jgi:acetoin utilization protein AcuB
MLTTELINHSIPRLQLQDTVGKALQLLNDFRLTHLPVMTDGKYLGLISESDLLDAENEQMPVALLQETFITRAISGSEHFLAAVNFSNQYETSTVPVVNEERELAGVITTTNLLKALGDFSGANSIGGIIVLEMERVKFAISEISRIVESNDATILHLNTTTDDKTGMLSVTIHLNKKDVATIVASFERYEYNIVYSFGDKKFESAIHTNFLHLMNYLDI